MLTRLNTSSEISILPMGLGNHYASNSRLVPPGKKGNHLDKRQDSIFSRTTIDPNLDNPDAPEANMSFRSESDYFGPDVLVLIGVILASGGAILTLVSFYCQFKHPAIQSTVAGIGPSLIGIGMLFCVLRLFFCSFFTTRTCCECFAEGLMYLMVKVPCLQRFQKRKPVKKKVHPLNCQSKDPLPTLNIANGQTKLVINSSPKSVQKGNEQSSQREKNGNKVKHKTVVQYKAKFSRENSSPPSQEIEMAAVSANDTKLPDRPSTLRQGERDTSFAVEKEKEITDQLINSVDEFDFQTHKQQEVEDMLKDEIASLDRKLCSANSDKTANDNINDLVLKRPKL